MFVNFFHNAGEPVHTESLFVSNRMPQVSITVIFSPLHDVTDVKYS